MDNHISFEHTAEELLMEFTINNFTYLAINYLRKDSEIPPIIKGFIADGLYLYRFEDDDRTFKCSLKYGSQYVCYDYFDYDGGIWLNDKKLGEEELTFIGDKPLLHIFNGVSTKRAN